MACFRRVEARAEVVDAWAPMWERCLDALRRGENELKWARRRIAGIAQEVGRSAQNLHRVVAGLCRDGRKVEVRAWLEPRLLGWQQLLGLL